MRTGPYVPAISFPAFSVVVTQCVKDALERSGLTGFVLSPVFKTLIVRIDWHDWDRTSGSPLFYPPEHEPENYICDQPHCEETAASMPRLWELTGTPFGQLVREGGIVRWICTEEPRIDFLSPNNCNLNILVVSHTAKEFLAEISNDSIEFSPYDNLKVLT